ncbi:MAG: hypothetical protein LBG13_03505 [Holosporales bacterium]|nr:hypothetical protein [Holosporales bacterium]
MGQKFFLHKNKKACYNTTDTCSCGFSFPGDCAGLIRRGLVYASWSQAIIPPKPTQVLFLVNFVSIMGLLNGADCERIHQFLNCKYFA